MRSASELVRLDPYRNGGRETGRRTPWSDGSAVLGLGDVGPLAALPVLEGKAALFKRFAGIDAWPLCLDTRDVAATVAALAAVAPGFGGVNLEESPRPGASRWNGGSARSWISRCSTTTSTAPRSSWLGALLNALRVMDKEPGDVRVVISGTGAAGVATAALPRENGVHDVAVFDSHGSGHPDRDDLPDAKRWLAGHTAPAPAGTSLREGLRGADVFVGVSAPSLLEEDVAAMNDRAIVFALANPDPEVDPDAAARHAAVVATGRSDRPNQINNVLVFPGVFRGLLDTEASELTTPAQCAAARAIAAAVPEPDADHIVPSVFDENLVPAIARAVAGA